MCEGVCTHTGLPNAKWLRYQFRHDPQGVRQDSHPHHGSADTEANNRGSVAHMPSTRMPVTTSWSQRRSKSATEIPHRDGNSFHQQKKIGNARHRCFVVLSGQGQTAIEIFQLAHRCCDKQEFGRVVTGPWQSRAKH